MMPRDRLSAALRNVAYWPKADILIAWASVRTSLLLAQNGSHGMSDLGPKCAAKRTSQKSAELLLLSIGCCLQQPAQPIRRGQLGRPA